MGPKFQYRTRIFAICLLSWVAAIAFGWSILTTYDTTAGESGSPLRHWPATAAFARPSASPTLVLFGHPQCPCTRASVHQLSRIVAASPGRLKAYVVLLQPEGYPDSWTQSSLWRQAREIPGVTAVMDRAGRIARNFGAKTSGQVLLFDRNGDLVFAGGITQSRGHEGDNLGSDTVVNFVATGVRRSVHTPVFGCSLITPTGIGI